MATGPGALSIEFPARFRQYAEAALLRLQVRYPDVVFLLGESKIEATPENESGVAGLRRDILHAIYAEKVYTETLPMRQALLMAVMAR